mgnify:CR=1 FL=1
MGWIYHPSNNLVIDLVSHMWRKRNGARKPYDGEGAAEGPFRMSSLELGGLGPQGPEGGMPTEAESARHITYHYRPWGYGQAIPLPCMRWDEML